MLPGASIQNQDGQTGVAPQADPEGIIALIAASRGGTLAENVVAMYTDWGTLSTDAGNGPLPQLGAYFLDTTQKPILVIRVLGSLAGSYEHVDNTGMTGACVASSGGGEPNDSYDVLVVFVKGGTVGTSTDITYQLALDGDPNSLGPITALGNATTITPANTGITINLSTAAVNAGDSFEVITRGPRVTSGDLTAALAALAATTLPWESVFVDGDADETMIAAVDEWLAGLEPTGEYKVGVLNARYRNVSASESESAYAASMQLLRNVSNSTRVTLAADASDVISPILNIFMRRPAQLGVAAREMAVDYAVMASYVNDGPLENIRITDPAGNPKYHNEQKNPGLDDLGFSTLRTIPRRSGTYNTLTRLWSAPGSDWVFWPHARVMNLAKSIAYDVLTGQCSIGVHVRANPQNPQVKNITESDAQKLESLVQAEYDAQITPKRASSAGFSLSRTDSLTSNGPSTLTGTIQVGALRYVVKFSINAKFV